jgi:hypothetical protein
MARVYLLLICLTILISNVNIAQISSGGIPLSFDLDMSNEQLVTFEIPEPDMLQVNREDSLAENHFMPHRFCVMVPVNIDHSTSGVWTDLPDGRKIWRLKLKCRGALATSLYFKKFKLTDGVRLYLYDETGNQVKGAFTDFNNHPSGLFATELIYNDVVILELDCPSAFDVPTMHIKEIAYAYRDIPKYEPEKGFGGSDFCEVNINCNPEGDEWQDEKNGIIRIQVKVSGSGYWCTGSLINNARNDNTPYVLTADHCAFQAGHYATADDLNQWLFYFKYESPFCEDPLQEPYIYSMVGAARVAQGGNMGSTGSDFYLIRLNQPVPSTYDPYFLGWNAIDEVSSSGVTIHHPEGDIKKISTYITPLVTSNWFGSGYQSHWKVFWTETENGWGVTEPGSSGSPLFNEEGKLIGTLTGGSAACESSGNSGPDKPDYYGKFSYHWQSNGDTDSAQLKPWLDPDGLGITELIGKTLGFTDTRLYDESINIFPNPALDIININFINFELSALKVVIFDIVGKQINNFFIETNSDNIKIDISSVPEGVYTVRIDFEQGCIMKKVIKMK